MVIEGVGWSKAPESLAYFAYYCHSIMKTKRDRVEYFIKKLPYHLQSALPGPGSSFLQDLRMKQKTNRRPGDLVTLDFVPRYLQYKLHVPLCTYLYLYLYIPGVKTDLGKKYQAPPLMAEKIKGPSFGD